MQNRKVCFGTVHRFLWSVVALSLLLIVACVFGDVQRAEAWGCYGHLTVALVARRHLDPNVAAKVEEITGDLSRSGPFPQSPDFVQTACWADDLKTQGNTAMRAWHFVDKVYNPTDYPISKIPPQDDGTIEKLITTLLSTVRQSDLNTDTPQFNLEFAIANLIHFYGDIHQPLHCTTMFSREFPNGDKGGNSITVHADGKKINLHALWDDICNPRIKNPSRPMTDASYDSLAAYAEYLENTYTFPDSEIKVNNATKMALESLQLSEDVVYPGVYDGVTVSSEYLSQCKETAESRILLAGLRLAYELNILLKDATVSNKVTGDKKTSTTDAHGKANGIRVESSPGAQWKRNGERKPFVMEVAEYPMEDDDADEKIIALNITKNIVRTNLAIGSVFKHLEEDLKNGKDLDVIDYSKFL